MARFLQRCGRENRSSTGAEVLRSTSTCHNVALVSLGGNRDTVRILTNRWVRAALCLLAVVAFSGTWTQREARAATPPNIVLILTDDQRWDSLWAMPTVQSDLVDHGVNFTNAFVANSSCCPSRASILTGEYSHSTNVYSSAEDGPQAGFAS